MSGRATLYAALGILIVGLSIYIILRTSDWSAATNQKEGFAVSKYDMNNIANLLPQIKSDIDGAVYTDVLIPAAKQTLYSELQGLLSAPIPKMTDADALQKAQALISPYNESSFNGLGADSIEYTSKAERFTAIKNNLPTDAKFFQIAVLPHNRLMYSRNKGQYKYYTDFTSEQIATLDSVKLSTDPVYGSYDGDLKLKATNQLNLHNLFYVRTPENIEGRSVYTIYNIDGKRIYIEDKTNKLKLITTPSEMEFKIPISNLAGETVDDSYINNIGDDIPFNILDGNKLQFNFGGVGMFQGPSQFHALKLIPVTTAAVNTYFSNSLQTLTNAVPSTNALVEKYFKLKYIIDALVPSSSCTKFTGGVKKVRVRAINLEDTFPADFVKFLQNKGLTVRAALKKQPTTPRNILVNEYKSTLPNGGTDPETTATINTFLTAPSEIGLNISQIAVIDINSVNIAINKTVTISDGSFTDAYNIRNNTVNGELFTKPSSNNRVWRSKNNDTDTSYLEIDLGNAFDLAFITYFGVSDIPNSIVNKGIRIECMNLNGDILDTQITTSTSNVQVIRLCNKFQTTSQTTAEQAAPELSATDGFDAYMDFISGAKPGSILPAPGAFPGFGVSNIQISTGEFSVVGVTPGVAKKELAESLVICGLLKLSSDALPRRLYDPNPKKIYISGGVYTREDIGNSRLISRELSISEIKPTYYTQPIYEEYIGESMRVALNGLGHFFRSSADTQCYAELEQDTFGGQYIEVENRTNITQNAIICAKDVTPTLLSLLPYATRTFVKQWFYNRDRRLIGYIYRNESADVIKARQAAVTFMEPLQNIDINQKYILDQIAQQFYEKTNGRYKITYIYDISTIGTSSMDIRFDCAKHAYSLDIERQMKKLRREFEYSMATPVAPLTENGVLEIKQKYYDEIDKLQMEQDKNIIYDTYTGILGKFFYEKVGANKINITGFTLERGAAHSFEPSLNGGLITYDASTKEGRQVPGNINYDPTTQYTQNRAEPMDFSKPWRQVMTMFDYADATAYDLSGALANAPNDPWDLSGTIKVKKIWGAIQVSPLQCMMAWEEDVIDPKTNLPYEGRSGIRRKALITYRANTADWFSNETIFDASGFRFLRSDTIETCVFRPADFRYAAGGELIGKSDAEVTEYFKKYGLRTGMSPCPTVNPGAVFSGSEYANANPAIKTFLGTNERDITEYYRDVGVAAGHTVYPAKTLVMNTTPLLMPVILPADSMLDDGGGTCNTTDCRDTTVMYSLVNQYNRNKDMSGNILKVLNAYTPGPNQCDLDVLIDYVGKAGGIKVPTAAEGVRRQKISMYTTLDRAKCEYRLEAIGGEKDPSTIVKETPTLSTPLDYTEEVRKENVDIIQYAFGNIASVANTTFNRLKDVLSSYRQGTYASIGDLAELDGCPGLRCGDPSVMQSFIRFYESKNWQRTRIAKILRAGTVNGRTCDYTYEIQPNGLDVNGRPVSLPITTTVGTRVTLQEDPTVKCRFNVSTFTPLMPSPSWDQLKDMTFTDIDRSNEFKGRDDINYVNTRPFRYVDCRGAKTLNQIAKFDQDLIKVNAIKNANMNQCISEVVRNKNTINYIYTFDIDENINYKVVEFVEGQILFNRPEAAAPLPGCVPLKEVFLVSETDSVYSMDTTSTSAVQSNTSRGNAVCKQYDSELATYDNLVETFNKGANWNTTMFGLAANGSFYKMNYTITTAKPETGIIKSPIEKIAGLTPATGTLCYGIKPKRAWPIDTPFKPNMWSIGEGELRTIDDVGNKRCFSQCLLPLVNSGPNCATATISSSVALKADIVNVIDSNMSLTETTTNSTTTIKKTSAAITGPIGFLTSKISYTQPVRIEFSLGQTNTPFIIGFSNVDMSDYTKPYIMYYVVFDSNATFRFRQYYVNSTPPTSTNPSTIDFLSDNKFDTYTARASGATTVNRTKSIAPNTFFIKMATSRRIIFGSVDANGTEQIIVQTPAFPEFTGSRGATFLFQTDASSPMNSSFTNVKYSAFEVARSSYAATPIICATGTDLYIGTSQNRCYGPCDPGLDDLGFICSAEKVTDPKKLLDLTGQDARRNTVVTFKQLLPETILPTRDCANNLINKCTDASGALIKYKDCAGNIIPCNTCTNNSVVCAISNIDSVNGTDFYGQKVYESEQISADTCKVRVLNTSDAAKAVVYGDIYKYMRFYQEYDCTIKHVRFDAIPCTAPLTCPAVGATVGGFTVYASQKVNDTTCEVRVLNNLAAAAANSYSDIYKRLNYERNLRDCTFNLVSVTPPRCTKSVNCFISGLDRTTGADFYGRRVYRSEQLDANTCRVKIKSDTEIATAADTTKYTDTTKLLRFRTDPVACNVTVDNEAGDRPQEPFIIPTIDKVNGTRVYGRLIYDAVRIGPYSIEARVLNNANAANSYTYGDIYKIITYRPSKTGSYIVDREVASISTSITLTSGATYLPQPVLTPPPLEVLPDMVTIPSDSPAALKTEYSTLNTFNPNDTTIIQSIRNFVTTNKTAANTPDGTSWALGKFLKWGKESNGAIIYQVSLAIQYGGKIVYIYPATAPTYLRVVLRKTGGTAEAPTIVVSSVEQVSSTTANLATVSTQGTDYTTSTTLTSFTPAPLKTDYDAVHTYSASDSALITALRTWISGDTTKKIGKVLNYSTSLQGTNLDTIIFKAEYAELDADGFYTAYYPETAPAILQVTYRRSNGSTAPPVVNTFTRLASSTVAFTALSPANGTALPIPAANITKYKQIKFVITELRSGTTLQLFRFQLFKNGVAIDPSTYTVTNTQTPTSTTPTVNDTDPLDSNIRLSNSYSVYTNTSTPTVSSSRPMILYIQPTNSNTFLEPDAFSFVTGNTTASDPKRWIVSGIANLTSKYEKVLYGYTTNTINQNVTNYSSGFTALEGSYPTSPYIFYRHPIVYFTDVTAPSGATALLQLEDRPYSMTECGFTFNDVRIVRWASFIIYNEWSKQISGYNSTNLDPIINRYYLKSISNYDVSTVDGNTIIIFKVSGIQLIDSTYTISDITTNLPGIKLEFKFRSNCNPVPLNGGGKGEVNISFANQASTTFPVSLIRNANEIDPIGWGGFQKVTNYTVQPIENINNSLYLSDINYNIIGFEYNRLVNTKSYIQWSPTFSNPVTNNNTDLIIPNALRVIKTLTFVCKFSGSTSSSFSLGKLILYMNNRVVSRSISYTPTIRVLDANGTPITIPPGYNTFINSTKLGYMINLTTSTGLTLPAIGSYIQAAVSYSSSTFQYEITYTFTSPIFANRFTLMTGDTTLKDVTNWKITTKDKDTGTENVWDDNLTALAKTVPDTRSTEFYSIPTNASFTYASATEGTTFFRTEGMQDMGVIEPMESPEMPAAITNPVRPLAPRTPIQYLRFQPLALGASGKSLRLGKLAFFGPAGLITNVKGAAIRTLNGTDRLFERAGAPTAAAVFDYHSLESEWIDSGLGTLLIALPEAQELTAFALLTGSDPAAAPVQWRLEGSADGRSWIPLHTQVGSPATLPTTPFTQSLVYPFDSSKAPYRIPALFELSLAAAGKRCDDPTLLETVYHEMATDAAPRLFNPVAASAAGAMCEYRQADDTLVRVAFQTDLTGGSRVKTLEVVGTPRQRTTSWEEEDLWTGRPQPARGLQPPPRIPSPLDERGFGLADRPGPNEISSLQEVFTLPLKQADGFIDVYSPQITKKDDAATPTVKYVRFRCTKTRGAGGGVALGSFALWARRGQQLELRRATASNPMGKWSGTVEDLAENNSAARGFRDAAGTPLVIAFPEPVPVAGFSWKTPAAAGTETTDPVRWKLEGSANGTYWFTLHDQARDYATPMERGWRLPLFWFNGDVPLFR